MGVFQPGSQPLYILMQISGKKHEILEYPEKAKNSD